MAITIDSVLVNSAACASMHRGMAPAYSLNAVGLYSLSLKYKYDLGVQATQ